MTYLTSGKRSVMEQGYSADVRQWAKVFGVPVPTVKVRQKRTGNYRKARMVISVPPNAHKDSLVHEFAHHLDHVLYNGKGHGASFRISLVQAATVAYGRAERYSWAREYANVVK
jgi:hypothetical protein